MITPQGPSRVPTAWQVARPVAVELMNQLLEIPDDLAHGWINQFLYMSRLFEKIEHLDGDVVECGLGEGNTFAMLYDCIGRDMKRLSRTLWGFDSFEGWPEPNSSDASPRNPKKGEWRVSEEMVVRRLEESGLYAAFPDVKVQIVKGFIGETLPRHFPSDGRIAFLHLDLDLYPGYHDALEYLFPLVVKGGLVLFDEYQEYHPELPDYVNKETGVLLEKWPGCSRAVNEYFANRPEKPQYYGPTNKYYIVKETD